MTKGTKAFRIIISVLLGITFLWTVYFSFGMIYIGKTFVFTEDYGIYVDGELITRSNKDDILGDGTVSYDDYENVLTFTNAVIENDYVIVYSLVDLKIELVGENKFICKDGESAYAIYASDGILRKDVAFEGDGSLTIEFENVSRDGIAIVADDLWIGADISITTPDCSEISNAIICTSSLSVRNQSEVKIDNGAAKSSTAISVDGNATIEKGSSLEINVSQGAQDTCNGFRVEGELTLGRDSSLKVSVDDENTENGNCIWVSGLLSLGKGSAITASAKKANIIECYGTIVFGEDAIVSGEGTSIFCSGAIINEGAAVNAEFDALGGSYNKSEN